LRIVDLTVPLNPATLSLVPGHPPFQLQPFFDHERNFRCSSYLQISTHTGTHVDEPFHFVKDGSRVGELDLRALVGRAVLLDLRPVARPRTGINSVQLKQAASGKDLQGKIAILHSGWLKDRWGTTQMYSENPFLLGDAAEWLVAQGIRSVGLDFAMDNPDPGDLPEMDWFPIHRAFLSRGIVHIENLCNLERIDRDEFFFVALPMKLQEGEGAPAGAIAILDLQTD